MFEDSEAKLLLIIAALSQLFQQMIANMATVIIPEISMELNINADMQLWINLAYLCALVAVSLPLAKLIAKKGVKKSVNVSCIIMVVSLLLCGFSIDFYMLLIARILQGLASAALAISIYSMLTAELEDEELGTALGIVGSCGYIGLMIAPSLTGIMTYLSGWRMSFLVIIPIFVLQLILLRKVKKEWILEDSPIDRIGALIFGIILILFVVGLTELDGTANFLLLISVLLIPIIIRYEKKLENPIINLKLLTNLKFMIGTYAAMATYFVTTIAITVLTFHLIYPLDRTVEFAGVILLITPMVMVGISIIAGRLSSIYDPRIISGCAMSILLIAMIMFAFMDYLSLSLIAVACVIQGIGHGFFSSPNNKYVLTLVDEEDLSDASAMLSMSKEFGKIVSSGIYVLLMSILLEDVVLGPAKFDDALIFTNYIMMIITCVVTFSAIVFLFYSYFRYERYENPELIKKFRALMPKRMKKWMIKNKDRLYNQFPFIGDDE